GVIAFEAEVTTRPGGLVVMDADGSHAKLVTDAHAGVAGLVVARGAYAYARVVGGVYEHAMVTDAAGTRDLGLGEPLGFSPDGKLLLVADRDASFEVRDRVTGATRGSFPAGQYFAGWSPGGLLWTRGTDLVVTQADGSGAQTAARDVV